MRFAILGPLRVTGPDGPVEIGAPKQRALLAMLLLGHRDEAVALFRGEPLADVLLYGPAASEAERLVELRLAALERRIELDLELGRSGELVSELEALIAEHSVQVAIGRTPARPARPRRVRRRRGRGRRAAAVRRRRARARNLKAT